MQHFLFSLPTRVVFGAGTIDQVGTEATALGKNVLVVTGGAFAHRSGLLERVTQSVEALGGSASVYTLNDRSPEVASIDEGGSTARERGAEVIVGLGGGSAMDAAKAVALAAATEGSIWDYARHGNGIEPRPIERALPLVQVPIIASTGSETSDTAVILNQACAIRAPIRSAVLQARAAIVDPTLSFTVPQRYTAVGGMNIVSQMMEGYLTADEFSVTDRITEGLIRVVLDSLPRAMRRGEDLDARTNLAWAAALAPVLSSAGRTDARPLRHMAYPLSAKFNLEHGMAVAALWPSFMRYALANRLRLPQIGRFKRYALLGRQIFGVNETDDEVAAETTSFRFVNWLRGMEMPTDLRALAIDSACFRDLADQAVAVSGRNDRLPGGLSSEDVENIYLGALRPA